MNLNLPKATYIKVLREIESYTYVKLLKVPKPVFCWENKRTTQISKKRSGIRNWHGLYTLHSVEKADKSAHFFLGHPIKSSLDLVNTNIQIQPK